MKCTKIFLALVLLIMATLNYTSFTKANEQHNLLNQQKEKLKKEDVHIQVMTKNETENVITKEDNVSKIKDFKNQMLKDGYTELNLPPENTSLKYINKESEGSLYGYITNHVYKNNQTNEIVISQTIYDNYNNKITKFVAEKQYLNKKSEGKILINYNDQNDTTQINPNSNQMVFGAFKFAGKSFACSMGGLYACGHFCGIWALVNPIAGGTCAAVCGTAFAAACSVSKK